MPQTPEQRIYELETAIRGIIDAVDRPGPQPDIHRQVVEQTRRQWPTLFKRIDAARRTLHS